MRRLIMAVVAAALMAVTMAPAATAAPPEHFSYDFGDTYSVSSLCTFDVTFSYQQHWDGINRYDADANPLGAEATAKGQDTFTANGKTLVSEPYTFHVAVMSDENGFTKYTTAGVIEKIRLPDGSLFLGAGWFTWLDKPDDFFGLNPDRGRSGDVEALCAALAP